MSARIEAGRVAIKTAQLNRPTKTVQDKYNFTLLFIVLVRINNALSQIIITTLKGLDKETHIEADLRNSQNFHIA
jgi:hypothetical protein